MADNSGPFKLFWPEIDDVSSAKAASRLGAWACIVLCVFTAATVTYGILRTHGVVVTDRYGGYVDAAIFALLALGIWKMWRPAALIALVLFVLEQVLAGLHAHAMVGLIMPLLLTLFLVSGIRGTILYHRYSRQPVDPPASDA